MTSGQAADGRLHTWLVLGLLIGLLFAMEVVAVHSVFASRAPGTADFYSRWAGARALLLEGRDPYSVEVTQEIQAVLKIDTSMEGKGGFAYPLYVLFTFWPITYLPYDWTQAIWMVTLQWVALAAVFVLLKLERWKPSPLGLVSLFLGTLFFYPVARTIMLGQFTLHVTLFLALALLALQQRHDGWAGVALAATTIKPQMVIFIGPWLVLWAIVRRRWRVLGGLLVGGVMLLLAAMVLFPRWPISFLEDVFRYSKVAGGRNPLMVLLDLIWPGAPDVLRYVLSGLLLLAMLAAWLRGLRSEGKCFINAIHWTIVVSLLVPFQTGTTNQVLLLIPWFAWLHSVCKRWDNKWVLVAVVCAEVALCAFFLSTIQGDWENPLLFLPLPLLSLVVLLGIELRCWRKKQQAPTIAAPIERS